MRIILTVLIVFTLQACNYFGGEKIHGSGKIITKQETPGQFHSIDASGSLNVYIKQDSTPSMRIVTDDNLMAYIETFIEDNTLVIRVKKGFNLHPTREVAIHISAPSFRSISLSGAGAIKSEGTITGSEPLSTHVSGSGDIQMDVNLLKFTSNMSGSGSIALKGQAKDLDVSVSGSGDVRCFDLASDNVSLSLSGSSNAEVTANKTLRIDLSGSSDVKYKGNASVNQKVSGSSDIRKVD